MKPRVLSELLKSAANAWIDDRAPRMGAALAFYTIFSMAPLLVITVAIAGMFLGRQAVAGDLAGELRGLVGDDGGKVIQTMLAHASEPAPGIWATVTGVILLLVGAVGVFGELQDSLNTIWEVQPKPGRSIWSILSDRFLPFVMVLGVAFLLLLSLVVSAALTALSTRVLNWDTHLLGRILSFNLAFVILTLLFAMIYRFLPDARTAWRDVWLGAAITGLLFNVGKYLIGLYLGQTSIGSMYGAAGSLAIFLVWLYYSAQIFLFGAELTKIYANRFGSKIRPAKNAVRLRKECVVSAEH